MGWLLETFDPFSRSILQGLLNSIGPGLIVVAVTWISLRSAGKTSAATRHAVWLVALLALAALPLLPSPPSSSKRTSAQPGSPPFQSLVDTLSVASAVIAPIFRETSVSTPSNVVKVTKESSSAAPARVAVQSQLPPPESTDDGKRLQVAAWAKDALRGRLPLVLISIWAVVAGVLLARVAWSFVFLMRVRRRLEPLPDELVEAGRELQYKFGIGRKIGFFASSLIGVPMTIGWARPLVILPPELVQKLTEVELEGIVAHELGHIRRWDYLTNLVQQVAQALLFFHPGIWVVGRSMAIERELACDDWAVKLTGEPRRYAGCLTKVVESLRSARPLAMATGIIFRKNVLSRRIEMILNRDRNAAVSVSTSALLSAAAAALMVVALSSLVVPVIAVPLGHRGTDLIAFDTNKKSTDSVEAPVAELSSSVRSGVAAMIRARLAEGSNLNIVARAEAADSDTEPVYELLESTADAQVFIAPRLDPFLVDVRTVSYQGPDSRANGASDDTGTGARSSDRGGRTTDCAACSRVSDESGSRVG